MHARLRTIVLAGALAGTLILAGCADDTTGPGAASGAGTESGSTSEQVEFNDADVAFVSGMIPHHQQAVEMWLSCRFRGSIHAA